MILLSMFAKAEFAERRGYETGLFAGVIMLSVVHVGKVNSVTSHGA